MCVGMCNMCNIYTNILNPNMKIIYWKKSNDT